MISHVKRIVILTKCYFPVKDTTEEGMGEVDEVDFMNGKGLSRKHIWLQLRHLSSVWVPILMSYKYIV